MSGRGEGEGLVEGGRGGEVGEESWLGSGYAPH